MPGIEYLKIGMFMGEFLWTLRLSVGDLSLVAASNTLSTVDNYLFWLLFVLTVGVTCIIFLNFIVAEACASYTRVTDTLDAVIQ